MEKEGWCPRCGKSKFIQHANIKSKWICLNDGCYCSPGEEPKIEQYYHVGVHRFKNG